MKLIISVLRHGIGNVVLQLLIGEILARKLGRKHCAYNSPRVLDNHTTVYTDAHREAKLPEPGDLPAIFPNIEFIDSLDGTTIFYLTCLIQDYGSLKDLEEVEKVQLHANDTSNLMDELPRMIETIRPCALMSGTINDYVRVKYRPTRDSVGIHLRLRQQGDYIVGKQFATVGWYMQALEKLLASGETDRIFIVSGLSTAADYSKDIFAELKRMITAQFSGRNVEIVAVDGEPYYVDMTVLAQCRRIIMSSSTFALSAALQNLHSDRHVIYPDLIFRLLGSVKDIPLQGCKLLGTTDSVKYSPKTMDDVKQSLLNVAEHVDVPYLLQSMNFAPGTYSMDWLKQISGANTRVRGGPDLGGIKVPLLSRTIGAIFSMPSSMKIRAVILFDKETGDTHVDQHYSKPFRYLAERDPSIRFLEFGESSPFKRGVSIFDIISTLTGKSMKEGPMFDLPAVYHLVAWKGLLVSDLEKYDGPKILDLEDQVTINYIFPLMPSVGAVTHRYAGTQPMTLLRSLFPKHAYFHLPHALDMEKFKDWGLEKTYDVTFVASSDNMHFYYFRQRLYDLLKKDRPGLRINYLNDARKWNQETYSRELNKSWLTVATPTKWGKTSCYYSTGYYLRKFMEIPSSGSVVLGYLPECAREDFADNYVRVEEEMTDGEILKIIDDALQDTDRLKRYSAALLEPFRKKYSYSAFYDIFKTTLPR